MCTKNDDHQLYDVWFLWYKVRWIECFVILYYFFPFYHPSNPENQNLEKKKQHLHMSSFYTRAPKITIIRCMLPEIWHAIDFVPFFALLFL